MDIHIDKKIAGLMLLAFIVGILFGAMVSFHHRGYGHGFQKDHMYFLQRGGGYPPFMMGGVKGNVQYFDEQALPPMMQNLPGTTTAPAPTNSK